MGSSPLELSKSPVGPLAESARCGSLREAPQRWHVGCEVLQGTLTARHIAMLT